MGGVVMWPLLFFSIATVAITIERAVFILRHDLKVESLKIKTAEAFQDGKLQEAIAFLQDRKDKAIGAGVLLVVAKGRGTSEHRLEKAVQAEASRGIASLESGLNLLTTLASISPLTGFLGTVTGMIAAFMSIADAADVNAQIVASGIYEALITTVFGLIIAIVAMSAHSIFSSITDKYTSDLEIACSDLIVQMHEPIQTKTLCFANQADLEGK